MRAEGQGNLTTLVLTPGERHETMAFEALMEAGTVERLINRLKQFRRLATRYEKRAENYRPMWVIAATLLWLQFAYTP